MFTLVRYVISLTQMQGKINLVRILDAFEHCLRLPPSGSVGIVEVGQVACAVITQSTGVTAFSLIRVARLVAEVCVALLAARIRRLHEYVVGGILELGNTTLEYKRGQVDPVVNFRGAIKYIQGEYSEGLWSDLYRFSFVLTLGHNHYIQT